MTKSTHRDTPNLPIPGAFATSAQLCAKYQISQTTWWRWSKSQHFPPALRFGRSVRWDTAAVHTFFSRWIK